MKTDHRRAQGLTLAEVIFGFLIMSVLLGMTAVSMRSSIRQEGPRGLAYALAENLRAARAEAQSSGVMVAVCFPNDNGTNPFSKSLVTLKGEQQGRVSKTVGFGGEFEGAVFIGGWPGGTLGVTPLPKAWQSSTDGHSALFFLPDGTVFSNNIPLVDGRFALVVGSAFQPGSGSGTGLPTITAISDPYTVSISNAGTVRVEARKVPGPELPEAVTLPPAAKPEHVAPDTESKPQIVSVDLLPETSPGDGLAGVGRTYVQIHPLQRTGERVEYGLATFKIQATDPDGGPLTYKLEAFASRGKAGSFSRQLGTASDSTVSEGRMTYVDTGTGEGVWQAIVSWRPPKGSPPTLVYDFELTVSDPDENTAFMDSDADLFPSIATLTPPRLVMQTSDGNLLMTTVDGTSMKNLTRNQAEEQDPFFSSDGTRLYCFSDDGSTRKVILRNSDGTNRKVLRSFPYTRENSVKFDPFYTFAAYLADYNEVEVYSQILNRVDFPITTSRTVGSGSKKKTVRQTNNYDQYSLSGTQVETVSGHSLMVMHLNSGEEVRAAEYASDFQWFGSPKFSLRFDGLNPMDPDTGRIPAPPQGHSSFGALPDYIPYPGYSELDGMVRVDGFPPKLVPVSLPDISDTEEVFNPAYTIWYVRINHQNGKSSLSLYNVLDPSYKQLLVDSGVGEDGVSWTPDGRSIIYAQGTRRRGDSVYIQNLLNDEYVADVQPATVLFTGSGVTSPQISADGKFAFFLRDGELLRVKLSDRGAMQPVVLTHDIDVPIEAFVVSR